MSDLCRISAVYLCAGWHGEALGDRLTAVNHSDDVILQLSGNRVYSVGHQGRPMEASID